MKKRGLSLILVILLAVSFICADRCRPCEVYAANENYARQVAGLVNKERSANGLGYLKYSSQLSQAARLRAQEIVSSFAHTRPDGTQCFTVFDEFGIGYYAAGENIAAGQPSPSSVMTAWMNSSGHRANILNSNFNYIGVGVVYEGGMYYWVQLFAGSDSLSGTVIVADGDANATDKDTEDTAARKDTSTTASTTAKATTTKKAATTTKAATVTKATTAAGRDDSSVQNTTAAETNTLETLPTSAAADDSTDSENDNARTERPGFLAWLWNLIKSLLGLS